MRLLIRFWFDYAHKHRWTYALGILCLLATNALGVLIPKLIQWSVEAFEGRQPVLSLALAILCAGVGTMIVRTLSRTLIFNPGRTVEYDMKSDLFSHILKLPRTFFEVKMTPGEIINRGTNDASAVRGLIGYGSLQLFNVSMTLLMTLSQMILLDLSLSLWCVGPLLLSSVILRWAVLAMFKINREIMVQTGVLGNQILESYGGVGVIQSFAAHRGVMARFDHENLHLLSLNERIQRIGVWALPIVSVVGSLCLVFTLYSGGQKVIEGTLSLGALTAFIVYINLLVSSLTSLGWLTGAIQRGYLSLERIYELFDSPLDRPEVSATLPPAPERGRGIELKNLSFKYPTAERATLDGVTFSVAPGEVLGVFGLTGSGKSTLLDLLSRTYDPPAGQLFIDGVDVTTLDITEYWGDVGYVQQTPFLFSQTLRENICIKGDFDDNRLEEAIEAACLESEIQSFPDRLETRVGERGVTLSGGQKQRSSLARAFYRDDIRLLLLDDVLSAVDHATEHTLISQIYAREPKCTTVIVSHRMSVLREADRVIVLDGGRVVEEGTSSALIEGGGLYASAWRAQEGEDQKIDLISQSEADAERPQSTSSGAIS